MKLLWRAGVRDDQWSTKLLALKLSHRHCFSVYW